MSPLDQQPAEISPAVAFASSSWSCEGLVVEWRARSVAGRTAAASRSCLAPGWCGGLHASPTRAVAVAFPSVPVE